MNEKVKKLIEMGISEDQAIFLAWDFLIKEEEDELTFDQCLQVYRFASKGITQDKYGELLRIKAATLGFEIWQLLWRERKGNHMDIHFIWTMMKTKAHTIQNWLFLLQESCTKTESAEITAILQTMVAVL